MSDDFSLVATRTKRANAGSRLKQLIELEEQNTEVQTSFPLITDDDENVNLLFQEDGEDEEFVIEDDFSNLKGIDEDDDDEDGVADEEGEGQGGQEKDDEGEGEGEDDDDEGEAVAVDADDVLSDSDISASDSDESEGEKELQKQERMKRKRTKTIIPAIKQKVDQPVVKKQKTSLISSETLLLSARRSSSRTSAVESKQALVQKLKESELRRAKFSPVPKVKHVALTQEQRLEEAIETERKNIISLNEFREQEIVKKEHQKRLLQLRRQILKNVIRLVSQESYVFPIDEINRAKRNYDADRKRRKGGRKKKQDELEFSMIPGEIDKDLPYFKAEQAKLNEMKEISESSLLQQDSENGIQENSIGTEIKLENGSETIVNSESSGMILIDDGDIKVDDAQNSNTIKEPISSDDPISGEKIAEQNVDSKDSVEESRIGDILKTENTVEEPTKDDNTGKEDSIIDQKTKKEDNNDNSTGENDVNTHEIVDNVKNIDMEENAQNYDSVNEGENLAKVDKEDTKLENGKDNEIKPKLESSDSIDKEGLVESDDTQKKRVKFSNEIESSIIPESREFTPEIKSIYDNGEDIFEGPPQKVARQMILLIDFEENGKNYRLDENKIKSILFGPQSLLPASRRFKDLKTIARIGAMENPYAGVKQDEDLLFQSITSINEDNEIFDELKRLPRLGIKQETIEETEENVEQESTAISIKTEAPTGLSLPNNNKKTCLISGTEVKYFDPYTGIPYSSVDTYKFIRTIEQGQIPWYSFTSDTNDTGVVEIYLGSREGNRHAKGVPEGFDG